MPGSCTILRPRSASTAACREDEGALERAIDEEGEEREKRRDREGRSRGRSGRPIDKGPRRKGLAGPLAVFALFTLAFFRNPARVLPGDERTVVAPADGRVLEAGEIDGPGRRRPNSLGDFLSVFCVHVNRTPLPGRDYCPSHQHLERTTLPARAAAVA